MTPDVLSRYARPVPRYTSYPTAPHFGPEVDARRYGAWLGELGAAGPLSLYLHIPFCRSLCWFCGCNMRVVNKSEPIERYLELLLKEIEMVADGIGGRPRVSHIHLGGGTPTTLSAANFARLADALRHRFDVAGDAAFAVEVDPRVLSAEQARALGLAGVNRASLGVQDFAPVVQKAVNRIQPYEVTARAIDALRANGIASINLDLLYGLPYQTVASVAATVERALTLSPDRLAVFGYAHVPWLKRHQRLLPEEAMPDAEERLGQMAAVAATLEASGYVAIGLDHFARADDALALALARGELRRNFQGYTADGAETLIGLGVSAIGSLPQGYVQSTTELRAYADAIGSTTFATVRGIALADDDRLRRDIIESLMCFLEAPVARLCAAYGHTFGSFLAEWKTLDQMIEDGVVTLENGHLRVTRAGRPLVRAVCAVFDRYLGEGSARHSVAV